MKNRFVSIIIPTYNDWKRLSLCVNALHEQSYPKDRFEVIIINNHPTDSHPEDFLLPEVCKLIRETKPGSYAARNAGLELAKGDIIGFTDSDCLPDKDWIRNAVAYLAQNNSCSRIAGHISVFSKNQKKSLGEKYDQIFAFPQKKYVTMSKSSVTANLFTYRKVFDIIGSFDDTLLSNGDLQWGRKAHQAGFQVDYVSNVLIWHPARKLTELVKKEKRIGGGRGMAERHWNNKLLNFFRLVNGCRPRLGEIKYVYANASHLQVPDKIKMVVLRHVLLQIRAFERLRVQLGKNPNRGI